MSNPQAAEESGGFGLNDVIYVVFKHKWKIIFAAVVGLVGAAVVQFFPNSPMYESEAKLLVRYIVETSTLDSVEAQSRSQGNRTSESILNAELAILTSWDIAVQTVDTVGVETLSRGSDRVMEKGEAVAMILENLTARALKGSDVIAVAYRHGDPVVATQVLSSIVEHYLKKHMEVHRGILAIDFVEQRTDQVRSRLTQTEQELQRLKTQSGIISVDAASTALDAAVSRSEESLYAAETELVEQQARVNEMERLFGLEQTSPSVETSEKVEQETPAPNVQQVEQYRLLIARLRQLRATEMDLLSRYRAEHPDVKRVRSEIGNLDQSRGDMETKFPSLTHAAPASATGKSPESDLATERKRLAAAEAKVQLLKERLKSALEARKRFAEVAPQITELERTKGLEETAYTYMAGRLERARVDRALDPSNIENIMPVQRPTPAVRVTSNRKKIVVGLAGGGIAFGLALAIALEVFVNRTVKRRVELEALLHTPALLAIPQFNGKSARFVTECAEDGVKALSHNSVAPWDRSNDIYPYAEAIRDRLNIYFDINNLKHKPKLIAVTGFAEGDGASTVAASLAAALSDAADGKVLLVDLNTSRADAHPFFGGRPVAAGDEQSPEAVAAPEHFFLASPTSLSSGEPHTGTRKFHELMPKLRASHFDYIVFDMPALGVAHPAVALSRYMDKVLLVIGAERHNPDAVKRRYTEIVAARANVSCIFNKVPSYAPAWALHEA